MIEVNPLKESLLLGSLNVVLPTVDVYSDVALAVKLYSNVSVVLDGRTHYSNGHPKWATSLLIPFLVNYLLSWRAWYYKGKENKMFTWIFALLGCYPQLVAGRIIWLLWKKPSEGMREKKHLERNVMENEIVTEAIPSTLIMTAFLFLTGKGGIIIGDNLPLFCAAFATSALSAGLGLAKCLKVASTQYFVLV